MSVDPCEADYQQAMFGSDRAEGWRKDRYLEDDCDFGSVVSKPDLPRAGQWPWLRAGRGG